ncbi:hypothetical protein cypCar_00012780 [Cyprinus carpio]|nr:hypothetical protein cypCar_00012780 [Cyprinus carpio]
MIKMLCNCVNQPQHSNGFRSIECFIFREATNRNNHL